MTAAGEDESFRVTDRRRRSDDEDNPAPAPSRIVDVPRASDPPPPPKIETARPPSRPADEPSAPLLDQPGSLGAPERSLAGLFVMLANSAAMEMGDAPDPMTGEVHRDLGQAAEVVDLLILLREKTEGNRTAEETQVLDEILYELQLRYVAATKKGGRLPGPARS